jgi:hypothetical protein
MNWHNELGQIAREPISPVLNLTGQTPSNSAEESGAQLIKPKRLSSIYSLLALELIRIF